MPDIVYLAQGETVTFAITNAGTKPHGFTIGAAADVFIEPPVSKATASVAPGGSANVRFTVSGVGPFAFASHNQGDLAGGQVGYVIVVGPDVPRVGTQDAPRLIGLTAAASGPSRRELSIARGETITFLVGNVGAEAREFVVGPRDKVVGAAIDQITTVTTGPIPPGQVKPLTYTFPADGGSYAYATHVAGAAQSELPGTITFR